MNKPDLIKAFTDKSELLLNSEFDNELNIYSFFETVFFRRSVSDFELEQSEEYVNWREGFSYIDEQPFKYNPLAVELVPKDSGDGLKQGRRWVLFEGVERDPLQEIKGGQFVITSPITYVGRTRTANNARYCYGFAIDLDGVKLGNLGDVLHQMRIGHLPTANIIVNSGTGLHIYYLFAKPIALFKNISDVLQKFKLCLIDKVWNWATSTLPDRQLLGIYQGFRVPETPTKLGYDIKVKAFKNDDQKLWTIGELNDYIDEEQQLKKWEIDLVDKAIFKPDRLTKKQAKALYPEWYEKVIERGDKSRKTWSVNRGLYEWWKKRLCTTEVKVGHRFLCLVALGMFAKKCGVSYSELEKDALSYVDRFEDLTEEDDNHFTVDDAKDSLKSFKNDYCFISRRAIERITGIRIDGNRRNHRKRAEHLKVMNIIRDNVTHPNGIWRAGNGRPIATPENSEHYTRVQEWREKNPDNFNKSKCARETGLSRPTVTKWWYK